LTSPEILRRLVRRFGLLLLLTLIGGIAGAVYGAVKTPTYTAKAYVVAIGDQGDAVTALNFAQAYGRIATSGPILARAGERLGADRTGLTRVTASTSPDAPVIQITAPGAGAQRTADMANAVANALVAYGNVQQAQTKVSLAVLAAATPPPRPTSPKPPLELAVGAAGGLLIGGLAVLAGVGRPAATRDDAAVERDTEEEQPGPDGTGAEEARPGPVRIESPSARWELDGGDDVIDAEEADEPPTRPAAIGRYLGVARAHAPKAITSYRASAVPIYLVPHTDGTGEADPATRVPAQRVVGRAAVAGMEDE
jgi:capsular polysaccharide biosynthesis protein